MSEILSAARLALAEAERLRDLHWREVESLRERLDKEEEERGRQYGMRVLAGLMGEVLSVNEKNHTIVSVDIDKAEAYARRVMKAQEPTHG